MLAGLEPQVLRRKISESDEPPRRNSASDWPSSDSDDDRPLAVALGVKRPVAAEANEARENLGAPDASRPIASEKPPPPPPQESQTPSDWPVQDRRPQPFSRAMLHSAATPSSDPGLDSHTGERQSIPSEEHAEQSAWQSKSQEIKEGPPPAQMSPGISEQAAPAASPGQATVQKESVDDESTKTPGVSTDAKLQDTLMRIGLQSILSPSKQEAAFSTQDVESAALPKTSPLVSHGSEEGAAAASGNISELETAEETAISPPSEKVRADASIRSEQAVAGKATTDSQATLPIAMEPSNLQLVTNKEEIITANVQQDAASEASRLQTATGDGGTGQSDKSSRPALEKQADGEADGLETNASSEDFLYQDGNLRASLPELPRDASMGQGEAFSTDVGAKNLALEQQIDPALCLDCPTEAGAVAEAAEHSADKQLVPAIIPDSEEEEETVHD